MTGTVTTLVLSRPSEMARKLPSMADDGGEPTTKALGSLQATIKHIEGVTRPFRALRLFDADSPFGRAITQQTRIANLLDTTRFTVPRLDLGVEELVAKAHADRERERVAKESEREAIEESANALKELAAATRSQTMLAWKVGLVSALVGAVAGAVLTMAVQLASSVAKEVPHNGPGTSPVDTARPQRLPASPSRPLPAHGPSAGNHVDPSTSP